MNRTKLTDLNDLRSHIFMNPAAIQSDLWKTGTVREKLLMFTLLIFANHEPGMHNGLEVPRGTVYMSRVLIQKIGGFQSDIRRSLEKLEKRGLIETSVKRKRLFIVIKNFNRCLDPTKGYDYGRESSEFSLNDGAVPCIVPSETTQEPFDTRRYNDITNDTMRNMSLIEEYLGNIVYNNTSYIADNAQEKSIHNMQQGRIMMGPCPDSCHDYSYDSTYLEDHNNNFRADIKGGYSLTDQEQRTVKIYHSLIINPAWSSQSDNTKLVALTMLLCAEPEENIDPYKATRQEPLSAILIMSYADIARAAGKNISRNIVRHAIDCFKDMGFCRMEYIKYRTVYKIATGNVYDLTAENNGNVVGQNDTCPEISENEPLEKNGLPIYIILSYNNKTLLSKGYTINSDEPINSITFKELVDTYLKDTHNSDTIKINSDKDKKENIYTSTGKKEKKEAGSGQKKKPVSPKKDRSYLYTKDDMEYSKSFYKVIQKEQPELHLKVDEHTLEEGAIAYNRLHRVDKYEYDFIIKVLGWAIRDDFWRDKIFSVPALRKRSRNGNTKFQNMITAYKSHLTEEKRKNRRPSILEIIGE
jgi:hypothetical protein